jgi:regulator of sirC expression with transglutaminase-like and TPR domain
MLFDVYGFQGNKQNHTAPQNTFISDVISTRKGNPLSLAVIYQVLANSLDIPIYGVNLPSHFVLCYLDSHAVPSGSVENRDYGVLFYINPFSDGTVINADEIDEFLGHLDIQQQPGYYGPCSNVTIVNRMLNNLIYAFGQSGKENKVQEVRQLQEIIKDIF